MAHKPDIVIEKKLLKVAIIQPDVHWQDVTANLAMLEEDIAGGLAGDEELIVLPEMFNTGFSMLASSIAEVPDFTTTRWMKQIAARYGALVMGSMAIRDKDTYYNRLLCVYPDGSIRSYDKRHLFRMGDEHLAYSPGKSAGYVEWKGWKIRPLVCYDLRFPVWSRNRKSDPYDLLVYVANWPAVRSHAWNTLLPARAIENQCYVIGVNRTGTDGNGIIYQGESVALGFRGELIRKAGAQPEIHAVSLAPEPLAKYRADFPAWYDADAFEIVD